jgi:hypothetical protein
MKKEPESGLCDTPDNVDIMTKAAKRKSQSNQGFLKNRGKKICEKVEKPLALSAAFLYNMTVVCLWDETASCRPALAGNCSGPARPDRATGSHFPPPTMRFGEESQRDSPFAAFDCVKERMKGCSPL